MGLWCSKQTDDSTLERYFSEFRHHVIGHDTVIPTPSTGPRKMIYADWTASGRSYAPIEKKMVSLLELVANTHSEGNTTARIMTQAYHESIEIIKRHVHANDDDVLIAYGSGMTAAINKFQRILGLKWPVKDYVTISEYMRPVVFVTHQEHHSNQTSWGETIATVVVVPPNSEGMVSVDNFKIALMDFKNRKYKFASISACSNVSGICTPYHEIAALMHSCGGFCFVDFATSFGYVDIFMHNKATKANDKLDAIFFSPHKLLGGPGSAGIAVFDRKLYSYSCPDCVGGGIVKWTNPWGEKSYVDDIEAREDSGTPGFLQLIRVALAIRLKEQMGVNNIRKRESVLNAIVFRELEKIPNLKIVEGQCKERLSIFSFMVDGLHYNLCMKLLNDRFGIQTRAGCSCAGTLAHHVFKVSKETSAAMTSKIERGDYSTKPGWVRVSLHPTMSNQEVLFICDSIREVVQSHSLWSREYSVNSLTNEYTHLNDSGEWFQDKLTNLFSFGNQILTKRVQNPFDNDVDDDNDSKDFTMQSSSGNTCFSICSLSASLTEEPDKPFLVSFLGLTQPGPGTPLGRLLSRQESRSGP